MKTAAEKIHRETKSSSASTNDAIERSSAVSAFLPDVGNMAVQRFLNRERYCSGIMIGAPGDPAEKEADRKAERVLSERSPPPAAPERRTAARGKVRHAGPSPAGRPLPEADRRFFEFRFGRDFSGVRTHTGGEAADACRALSADAFALGNHIAFAEGRFAPGSATGRRLLAHELAHVVQQDRSEARERRPTLRRHDRPPTSGGGNPPSGPSRTEPNTLSNQDLIAEIASVRDWISAHGEASTEREAYLERRRLLLAEKQRRIAAGHAWLAHTDQSTPSPLYQLVQQPDGLAIVRITDSRIMTEPGGLNLGGSRVVTQSQMEEIRSAGAGSGGINPPVGTAAQPFDPVAGALNRTFGGRNAVPVPEGGGRAPGMVRVVAPNGRVVLAPYTIMHPGQVPGPFQGAIMDMSPLSAGQINNPAAANEFQGLNLEQARGPNAGEVNVRQMGVWAQNAPEVRILLARVGNELVFVGYDTSQYHPTMVDAGFVESQVGSGGVGRALFADRVFRALLREVPNMNVQVGNSERTAAFHRNIAEMRGASETPGHLDRYTLNTRQMVEVLLQSSDALPRAQRTALQALIANGNNPAPAEVSRILGQIPEPRAVAMPGGGGYLRAFGYGGGFGAAVPTLIQGGQMLFDDRPNPGWQWQLGSTAGMGFASGGSGALVEQGMLNAMGPSLSRSIGGRMLGGGMGGFVAAPLFVTGSMALSDQSYPTSEYMAQGGRAATSGLLSGALSAGVVTAIWGSEVPLLGNVVGFVVGFVGYLVIDGLIGEDVADAIRRESREMGEAIDWAAQNSPGSFFAPGIATPFGARGGLGGLVRSPLDVMRENQRRPAPRRR